MGGLTRDGGRVDGSRNKLVMVPNLAEELHLVLISFFPHDDGGSDAGVVWSFIVWRLGWIFLAPVQAENLWRHNVAVFSWVAVSFPEWVLSCRSATCLIPPGLVP